MENISTRELVEAIYMGALNRRPDQVGQEFYLSQIQDGALQPSDFIKQVLASPEFSATRTPNSVTHSSDVIGCSSEEALQVFSQFDAFQGQGRSDYITNFLGGVTNTKHVNLPRLSGTVEGYPIPRNFHADALEWFGVLKSVLEAKDEFAMIELGAGWAPWCVVGYKAAQQKGLKAKVIAVEGDAGHVNFIQRCFSDNGLDPSAYEIMHGVVGVSDGEASFPRSVDASTVYGGAAAFGSDLSDDPFQMFVTHHNAQVAEIDVLPCFSLATLLAKRTQFDLVHCDIQGAEADLFEAHIDVVSEKVKRVLVGTHSFEIDRRLATLFPRKGWISEGIENTSMIESGGVSHTTKDGTQIWMNPAFI